MPYWRLFYHVVWATKGRHPIIGEREEGIIRGSLRGTFREMGVIPHAIGMMPDHIHVVVSAPPKVAPADLVKRMKGASAHALNDSTERLDAPTFAWQAEYGILSFGDKVLPDVIDYVQNQQARHASRQTWDKLERIVDDTQPTSVGLSG